MNLKALYENLLSNQTPETIKESSDSKRVPSPGERILGELSAESLAIPRRKAVKESTRDVELTKSSKFPEKELRRRGKAKEELVNESHHSPEDEEGATEIKKPMSAPFPSEFLTYRKSRLNDQLAEEELKNHHEDDLDEIAESSSNKRIRPRIQESSVKFPDISKLKKSKKPRLLEEAAGDEEEFEAPQDEFEAEGDAGTSNDSVEEEMTGFSLDDAVLIDGDLVLTISKDSGHVVTITLTDIDLDEESLVYNKSEEIEEENEEEEERLSESAKLRKKFLSDKQ